MFQCSHSAPRAAMFQVYLKRGADFSAALRLDFLLRKKAEEGVRIFVLLYKELQLALALDSLYTKRGAHHQGREERQGVNIGCYFGHTIP